MSNGDYLPFTIMELFCFVYAAVMLLQLKSSSGLERETIMFRKMLAAYIVLQLTDMVWGLSEGGIIRVERTLYAFDNAAANSAVALGCYYWYRFTDIRMHSAWEARRWVSVMLLVPVSLLCVLNLISVFTGWIFYIDDCGVYQVGKYFWLQGLITYMYLMIATIRTFCRALRLPDRREKKEYYSYAFYMIPVLVVVNIEDILPTVPISSLCILLMIHILFLQLFYDRTRALAEKEKELADSRAAVMLSQIQPHFLYNILLVIQDMCHRQDPQAEQTIIEFSRFLRGNLDSLNCQTPIAFEQELSHTKNYLALEEKRFGSRLRVEYDIRTTEFVIPALTLQPIVENAVKHGVLARAAGGTVRIMTTEEDGKIQITVTDNGVGFDPERNQNDGRTHIGISNVRERLASMCGGTLVLQSTPGKGTVVVITLPKGGNEA